MSGLDEWQCLFADALRAGCHSPDLPASLHPAFDVYRNTVAKGRIDALEANFPTVSRITGSEWFRAMAAEFASAHPPASPVLLDYGAGLADFLERFPPAAGLPYLADVARLDRSWMESQNAADAESLRLDDLAALTAAQTQSLLLMLHPSARIHWFGSTIPDLWLANWRDRPVRRVRLEHSGQGVVLVRKESGVTAALLDVGGYTFFRACREGRTLLQASNDALVAGPGCPLEAQLPHFIALGCFARPFPTQTPGVTS